MMGRLCRYAEKVFHLDEKIAALHDSRPQPQIPTSAIWTSAFVMSALRLGSLHALESELGVPKRLDALVGPLKPSADTMGRVYGLMDPAQQRHMLSQIDHRLGRNKVLPRPWGLRFAAVDGHEFFSQSAPLVPAVLSAGGAHQSRGRGGVLPCGGDLPPDRL